MQGDDVMGAVVAGGVMLGFALVVVVFATLIIGFVVFVVRYGNAERQRQIVLWSSFASGRGLALQGQFPSFSMHGTLEGTSFQFRQWRVRSGKHTHTHVEMTVPLPMPTGDLSVTTEGIAAKLEKMLGGQDIQLGDPAFDAAFVVRTAQPAAAQQLLGPMARDALRGAASALSYGTLTLSDGALRFRRQLGTTPDELVRTIAVLARAGSAFGR